MDLKRRRLALDGGNGEAQPEPVKIFDTVLIRGGRIVFADGRIESDSLEYDARRTSLKVAGGLWTWQCEQALTGHKKTGFPCENCQFVRFVPGEFPPGLADEIRVTHALASKANYFATLSPAGEWMVYQVHGTIKTEDTVSKSRFR